MMSRTSGALAATRRAPAGRPHRRSPSRPPGRPAAGPRDQGRTVTVQPELAPQRDQRLGLGRRTRHHRDRRGAELGRGQQRRARGGAGAEQGDPRHRRGDRPAGPPRPAPRRRCCRPAGRRRPGSACCPPRPAGRPGRPRPGQHRLLQRHGQAEPTPAWRPARPRSPPGRRRSPRTGRRSSPGRGRRTRPGAAPGTASGRSASPGPRSGVPALSCHTARGWPGTRPGTPRLICSNSRLGVGELGLAGVEVHRHEVQPLAVLRLGRRLQRGLARRGDRPGRQSLVPVGVVAATCSPGPSPSWCWSSGSRRRRPSSRAASFMLLVEPVVEDPRDLGPVLLPVDLALDDAGHGQHLVRDFASASWPPLRAGSRARPTCTG